MQGLRVEAQRLFALHAAIAVIEGAHGLQWERLMHLPPKCDTTASKDA